MNIHEFIEEFRSVIVASVGRDQLVDRLGDPAADPQVIVAEGETSEVRDPGVVAVENRPVRGIQLIHHAGKCTAIPQRLSVPGQAHGV